MRFWITEAFLEAPPADAQPSLSDKPRRPRAPEWTVPTIRCVLLVLVPPFVPSLATTGDETFAGNKKHNPQNSVNHGDFLNFSLISTNSIKCCIVQKFTTFCIN